MTAILPPPPQYRLTQNLTLAWLRLGKIAVFSVLAGLAAAAGLAFPGGDAAAQGYGGYTYTSRVCQEYGQQPRFYNVRDGQAAYNGGNSDSGWLIVLQRGTYEAGPGTYNLRTDGVGDFVRLRVTPSSPWSYVRITGNRWRRVAANNYVLDPNIHHSTGNAFLRTTGLAGWSAGDPTPDSSYLQISATRYQYIPGAPIRGGGQYVRWAHIAWCR